VQRFNANGAFIAQWGAGDPWWYWGQTRLSAPTGITADALGNLFVADTYHDRILRYDLSGNFLSQWGAHGSSIGRMASPTGLAVDAHERVFVADSMNNRVQRWDPCCGLTIGGDWEVQPGKRAMIVGWLGSFLPACAADRPISLIHSGEVLAQVNTNADGRYRFRVIPPDRHWVKYSARFDGAVLPGGEECPATETPDWWIHRAHGSQGGATVAQSSLRNAMAAAKTYFTDGDTYAGFNAAEAAAIEPSLNWVDATQPSGSSTVDIQIVRDKVVLMITRASTGRFYAICDNVNRGTHYGTSKTFSQVADLSNCRGDSW
jgi:hypothetical protein